MAIDVGTAVELLAAYILLTLFLIIAIWLTIKYEMEKGSTILGMIGAIFWMFTGAYSYFISGISAIPILFKTLGIVGFLGGIVYGLSAGILGNKTRAERMAEEAELEREPTMEEELDAARVRRRKTQAQRDVDAEAAREAKIQKEAERMDKKYRGKI